MLHHFGVVQVVRCKYYALRVQYAPVNIVVLYTPPILGLRSFVCLSTASGAQTDLSGTCLIFPRARDSAIQ